MFNGGTFNAEMDEWTGAWILSEYDNTVLSDDDPVGNSTLRYSAGTQAPANSTQTELTSRVYNHFTTLKNVAGLTNTVSELSAGVGVNVVGIAAIGVAPTLQVGDTFYIEHRDTGERVAFTCSTAPGSADTLLFFTFTAPAVTLPAGSIVSYPFKNLFRDVRTGDSGTTAAASLGVGTLSGSANTLKYNVAGGIVDVSGQLIVTTAGATGITEELSITLPEPVKAGTLVSGQMSIYNSVGALQRVVVMGDVYFATAGTALTSEFITNLAAATLMVDTDLSNNDRLHWSFSYQKA